MTDHNSITVEKWGMFEQRFQGPSKGNPFVDVKFDVQFTFDGEDFVKVSGFYDGNGEYVVRFMPEKLCICGRKDLLPLWNHLLCMDSSVSKLTGVDIKNALRILL